LKRYKKKDDDEVLNNIKKVLELRPSYGVPRVTAMINKERLQSGLKVYNKKRIERVMQVNGLTLSKSKLEGKIRGGTGKVEVLHSNTRWCTDGFEIKCFNGEKVYVVFTLDCADREAIHHIAKSSPIVKEDVQELLLVSVLNRFYKTKAPREIQLLSDRGLVYRSPATQQYAKQLNLKSCFTAAYSPYSNGMAEAFVNTIKRDYVYVNDCENSEQTIKDLKTWILDYNENAPHSSLKMQSPRDFIRSRRSLAEGHELDASAESGKQTGRLLLN